MASGTPRKRGSGRETAGPRGHCDGRQCVIKPSRAAFPVHFTTLFTTLLGQKNNGDR